MAAAAGNVKRVALELGGKSPNIIFADTDFETVVDNALTGAFVHSGQVCSAGCRVIVEAPIYDDFVAELARRTERIRLGSGLDEATETGPLISAEHRAKVERYVAFGIEDGARLVAGGHRPEEPALAAGFFFRPTVFADCDRSMRIVRDEIFGPVVTVERFETEDEAVALGNDTSYGLSGAVWTAGCRARPAGRRPAPPRHGLDQRLQRLPAPGRMGRLRTVRDRKGARPDGSGRVPRGEAHLPEHGSRPRALVRRLMAGPAIGPRGSPGSDRCPAGPGRGPGPRHPADHLGPQPVEDLRPGREQDRGHPRRAAEQRRHPAQDGLERRDPGRLLRRLAGRGVRGHGPVRERQVDPRPLPDPAHRAHGRRGPPRRRGHPQGRSEAPPRAPSAALRDGLPALRAAAPPEGHRQRGLRPRDPGRAASRSDTPGRARRSSWSAWSASRSATRTSCPAASSSGWGWPGRWRSTRRSCSSTSRSAPSTRSSGGTCRTRSSGSTRKSARR